MCYGFDVEINTDMFAANHPYAHAWRRKAVGARGREIHI